MSKIIAQSTVRGTVRRFAIRDTKGETTAKINNGIVVNEPAKLLLSVKADLICSITGPTEVNGDRNVEATKMMAKRMPHRPVSLRLYKSSCIFHNTPFSTISDV